MLRLQNQYLHFTSFPKSGHMLKSDTRALRYVSLKIAENCAELKTLNDYLIVERLANSWTNRWTISISCERLLSGRFEIRIWGFESDNYPFQRLYTLGTFMVSSSAHRSYFGHRFFIRTPIWVNQNLKNPGNRDLQFLCCNFIQIMGRYEPWKADVSYDNIYKPRFVSLPLYRNKY